MNHNETQNIPRRRIAIQGYFGAFHEIAARNYHADEELEIIPAETFEELVQVVADDRRSDGGMMAIENSIAGSLMYNYHLLDESNLTIIGEVFLRIRHQLMALPGQTIGQLREVHSHPMAIAQCRVFLRQYPHIKLIESSDTALSARWISEHTLSGIAAIGSSLAAQQYGLEVIASGIETNKQNFTRFLVLNKAQLPVTQKATKVSVCLTLPHQPGSLHHLLGVLLQQGADLTKIQSTPIIGQQWHYRFFIDFTLTRPENFTGTIDALREATEEFKILGTYETGNYHES